MMTSRRSHFVFLLALSVLIFGLPARCPALTAQEILEDAAKQGLGESFRIALSVKTLKGNKVISTKALWFMGRVEKKQSSVFVEFDQPADTKGLRFLVLVPEGKQPQAFMYLPATKRTLPMATDDPSVDIGGTGLTMGDIQVFVPKGNEKVETVKEEKLDGRECYVIRVTQPDVKGERLLWITKDGLIMLKSQNFGPDGKVERSLKVTELFKTAEGKEFPREEEILIPGRDIKILVRQENAVFGVEIPDELLQPEKFGTFKWRM